MPGVNVPAKTDVSRTTSASDEQLVARYRQSDESGALEELARRHLPRINGLLYQMVLDESAADDLTQEVFLRVLRQLDGFRGDSSFATWLYRVAMNTAYTYFGRRKNSPLEYRPALCETDTIRANPEGPVLRDELDDQISAALAQLSPKLRAAIVLTSIQGLEPTEAAKIENCTKATIYWRIHEARKQLRHRLRDYLSP